MRIPSFVTWIAAALVTLAALVFGVYQAPAAADVEPPAQLQARCGDYQCEPPEDCHSCAQDCGDCCGNHRCEPPEDCNSCPTDCC